jgi:hypothetical protein
VELPVILNRFSDDGSRMFVFIYGDATEEELLAATKLTPEEKTYLDGVGHPNRRKEWIAIRTFL